MADLSAYIDFSVQFDIRNKNAPVAILTDTGTYPITNITGIFSIIQPDTGERVGVFSAPDITVKGGSVSIPIRLSSDGKMQCGGNWIIRYEISHPDYLPTTLTKTFAFTYEPVTLTLTNQFDVFEPLLTYEDETNYEVSGFTKSLTRAWTAVSTPTGTITSTTSSLDLIYAGDYWDASYSITLDTTVVYTSTTYSYLSIKDKISKSVTADAFTPPSATILLGYLTTLKTNMDAEACCGDCCDSKNDYLYAASLYNHLVKRICSDDTVGAYSYVQEILDILHNHQSIPGTHTNLALAQYEIDCVEQAIPSPTPYDWIVAASTAGTKPLAAGDSSVTLPLAFAGFNIQFSRNNAIQNTTDVGDGTSYYSWNKTTRLFTISPAAALGELLRIHPSR